MNKNDDALLISLIKERLTLVGVQYGVLKYTPYPYHAGPIIIKWIQETMLIASAWYRIIMLVASCVWCRSIML